MPAIHRQNRPLENAGRDSPDSNHHCADIPVPAKFFAVLLAGHIGLPVGSEREIFPAARIAGFPARARRALTSL